MKMFVLFFKYLINVYSNFFTIFNKIIKSSIKLLTTKIRNMIEAYNYKNIWTSNYNTSFYSFSTFKNKTKQNKRERTQTNYYHFPTCSSHSWWINYTSSICLLEDINVIMLTMVKIERWISFKNFFFNNNNNKLLNLYM